MRKEFYKKIEIPEGIEVEIDNGLVKVKGPEGENSRTFLLGKVELRKDPSGKEIQVGSKVATKKEKKMINTIVSHIKNMIAGTRKRFEYELKVVFSHFPVTVEVKGREVLIKNFLGEKVARKTKMPEGADIEVNGNLIKISSTDKEIAGQAAARLETATKIRARDRIFMTKKSGREV